MNFTPEQITKAKAAKSVEELLAIAKENGMELTEDEAAKYFAEWHKEGELADEELNNVSGGCGGGGGGKSTPAAPEPKPTEYYYAQSAGAETKCSWAPICPNDLGLLCCAHCKGYEYTAAGQFCNGHHAAT